MLFLAMAIGLTSNTAALTSFESDADLAVIDHSGTSIVRVGEHATDGKFALKATFKSAEWPHLLWTASAPLDWKLSGALAADVYNPNSFPVDLGIRIDDDRTADGWHHSRSCTITLSPNKGQTVAIAFGIDPMKLGMRGLPKGVDGAVFDGSGDGEFDASHIVAYQFFVHSPKEGTVLYLDHLRLAPSQHSPADLKGMVDRFGQYSKTKWPGKVVSEAELPARAVTEATSLKAKSSLRDRDRFGGYASGPVLPATGFFRTEKSNGKWWLVDPEGRLFFSMGVDVIQTDLSTVTTGREDIFEWLPSKSEPLGSFLGEVTQIHMGPVKTGKTFDFYRANLYRKYGQGYLDAWRQTALNRLRAWGFNTIGNWSDETFYRNRQVPYVATGWVGGSHATVGSGSDYWGRMPDPFDPQFEKDARSSLGPVVAKVKGDPWCLGYFVDNELSWAGDGPNGRYGLAIGALSEGPTSPARQAFVSQLRLKYSDIASLNAQWQTSATSWETLRLPQTLSDASRTDASVFVKNYARRYFGVIRSILREGDPNHLYMGCRFAWRCPEAEDAAAEICDLVSFNIYAPKLDDTWQAVNRFDKPCIIGEFHFGALDRGMFHPGLVSTPNQAARAAMYIDYVSSVLHSPAFVGCHWFQYIDEPLTGRSFDGENYNIGFVNVTDSPYPEMVDAARQIHGEAYRLRLGGTQH
ncbi:MAG: hypothetical protein P4L46_10145 [Fimbriimonas sp.]|nr:hypothetical protein [Fimbriimonas sp.]